MEEVVLDNSVAMRWYLPSEKVIDNDYALSVLQSLTEKKVAVPAIFPYEATHTLTQAVKLHLVEKQEAMKAIYQLFNLIRIV